MGNIISSCFALKSNRKNMKTFILIVACIGLSSAFELSELLSGRFFCCAFINAKQQCHDTCSGQPCENRCEARCGAGSVCGSWTCGEVNDGGCTRTTTTPRTTTEACLVSGAQCMDMSTSTTLGSCCSGLTCAPPLGTCQYIVNWQNNHFYKVPTVRQLVRI